MSIKTFSLTDQDMLKMSEKLSKWDSSHKCKLKKKKTAIGGRLTYCFTPTSLGMIIIVKCLCGKEICLLDSKKW